MNWGCYLQINDNGYWKLMPGASGQNGSSSRTILIDGNLNMNLRQEWFDVSLGIKGYTLSATFNGNSLFNNVNDTKQRFSNG